MKLSNPLRKHVSLAYFSQLANISTEVDEYYFKNYSHQYHHALCLLLIQVKHPSINFLYYLFYTGHGEAGAYPGGLGEYPGHGANSL